MSDIDRENDADWGEPSERHDIDLDAPSDDNQKSLVETAALIKVDGTVTANWRGQSGCCDQARVDAEWRSAFKAWVDQQKAAHPTLSFVSANWGKASGECRKWNDWPNGRRCNGSLSGPVWAYFRQQA